MQTIRFDLNPATEEPIAEVALGGIKRNSSSATAARTCEGRAPFEPGIARRFLPQFDVERFNKARPRYQFLDY
jgi:hypothetical protein